MAEVDLSKEVDTDTFIGWFLAESITDMGKTFPTRKQLNKAQVSLTVNGVEVDFKAAMSQLEGQLDRLVKEKAVELLDERYGDVYKALETLKQNILVSAGKD